MTQRHRNEREELERRIMELAPRQLLAVARAKRAASAAQPSRSNRPPSRAAGRNNLAMAGGADCWTHDRWRRLRAGSKRSQRAQARQPQARNNDQNVEGG